MGFDRALARIGNHIPKLAVASDRDASKWMLEQTARSSIGFVDRFSTGIEEIGESVANVAIKP